MFLEVIHIGLSGMYHIFLMDNIMIMRFSIRSRVNLWSGGCYTSWMGVNVGEYSRGVCWGKYSFNSNISFSCYRCFNWRLCRCMSLEWVVGV